MNVKSQQQIGKNFAKWANQQIEEAGLGLAANTSGSGSGKLKGDSYNNLPFMFEFKSEKRPNWKGNIEQARHQAEIGNFDNDKWALIQRDPDTPMANPQAFAIIEYHEFLKLLKKNSEPLIKSPDRNLKWKLEKLRTICREIANEI